MRRRALAIAVGCVVAAALVPGIAAATPPTGLTSELLARGAAGEFAIKDKDAGFTVKAKQPTDLAIVRATVDPGGSTGFHRHPGRSMVVVESGTLTLYEPHRKECIIRSYGPGTAFVHHEDVHNFVNHGSAPVRFYVAYFVPEGAAPLLTDAPAPAACI